MSITKIPFLQISDEVNGLFYVMHNSYCKTKDLPFGNDCDQNWKIFEEKFGEINFWNKDDSVTFDCKKENR